MEFADDLERIVSLHGASTIAAVIVEPVAGSTGVLLPAKGYLERLRAICDRHGILLIFDEVITGFGRLGTPFAADYFGVTPDLMTVAKGLTSGVVPMGAMFVTRNLYETFMRDRNISSSSHTDTRTPVTLSPVRPPLEPSTPTMTRDC